MTYSFAGANVTKSYCANDNLRGNGTVLSKAYTSAQVGFSTSVKIIQGACTNNAADVSDGGYNWWSFSVASIKTSALVLAAIISLTLF